MQNAERAPKRVYQPAVCATQDEESKIPSCRRCDVEKEMPVHIQNACTA